MHPFFQIICIKIYYQYYTCTQALIHVRVDMHDVMVSMSMCFLVCVLFQAAVDSVVSFGSNWSLADGDGYLKGDYDISGEVRVKVEYKKDQLLIHIDSARGLAAADSNGYSDP